MSKHTAYFTLERETKGALRYQEVSRSGQPLTTNDADALVGTLYLRKAGLDGEHPDSFTLTIDTAGGALAVAAAAD